LLKSLLLLSPRSAAVVLKNQILRLSDG
jgi:hypothetical protein